MKNLIIALAVAAIAPVAIAQDTGIASATSVNRMDVSSTSTISGVYNTKLSTQYNTQDAEAFANTYGKEGIATSDASNLLIDRQNDVIVGDYNTVAANDSNFQDAFASARSHSWGTPARALTINELADVDDRFVDGYGNLDLRDKTNTQFGESVATGQPLRPNYFPGRPVIGKPVCTPTGICTR